MHQRVGPFLVAFGLVGIWTVAYGGMSVQAAKRPGAQAARGYLAANAQAGLVYAGLRLVPPGGACGTRFEVRMGKRGIGCTHGPDPAPDGRNVLLSRSLTDLRGGPPRGSGGRTLSGAAEPAPGSETSGAAAVPCIGDGTSGNRVQAVYAHPAGKKDRYAQVLPLIRKWAADVDTVISRSAAQTGGSRHVRFVTDAKCKLSVLDVGLSAKGDDTFQNTIDELGARGLNRRDRKYLVWMDSNVYCGIGQVYADDQPGWANANNGNAPAGMVARIDSGCWGLLHSSYSVEAHELVHTLGAVMPTAPHHSANNHCVDESDTMCYRDAPGVVMRKVCPGTERKLLDCGHDDYFNTNPAPGSYLATHWNAASSSFLEAKPAGGKPSLSGLSPLAGPAGTVVTITGASLSNTHRVTFNGRPTPFSVLFSGTTIKATVPFGATSGALKVTTQAGAATIKPGFGVTLSVTGFSPARAAAGATVTVKGIGFTGVRAVTFNGSPAKFTAVSPTVIQAVVPRKAIKGPIGVTAAAGTTSSAHPFLVPAPARHRRP